MNEDILKEEISMLESQIRTLQQENKELNHRIKIANKRIDNFLEYIEYCQTSESDMNPTVNVEEIISILEKNVI